MAQRQLAWGIIFFVVFSLTALGAGYFSLQLRPSAAPVQQIPANFLAAEKGYGVSVDLTAYDDDAVLLDVLNQMHEAGLTWLRQPINWAEIEPSPGQFNWQALDHSVGQVANLSYPINFIFVLHTSPPWARPANTPPTTPPTEVSDLGNFARALASRYGQQADYYQIWHEPNLSANWGNAFADPSAYTALLREAAVNIHAADPQAFILSAALAPTLETGPLNLSELTYLDQLYQAQAQRWFDIVAVQPYGFDAAPTASPEPSQLNFSRAELLRQVMLNHDDSATPLWATAFGWNALPSAWSGQPSPWQSNTPEIQARRTAEAIAQARRQWPWLGPMLAIRWDTSALAGDDPARGFALTEMPLVLAAIQNAATAPVMAWPGSYPAGHPSGQYSPGWRFAQTQADIPRTEPRTLTLPFEGTRLDLMVHRGPFRGYLWVTIDGQPANALPQDNLGRSYVVLFDPLRASELVTLAQNLPPGAHVAVIEAEGGWGQWAIAGWTVSNQNDPGQPQLILTFTGIVAALSGLAWLIWILRAPGQLLKRLWAWAEIFTALYAILGERGQIIATWVLAAAFYLSPGWPALLLLPILTLSILIRPDLGLALVAFTLSFFQAGKQLPIGTFSPVELTLFLTVMGFIFRGLLALGRAKYNQLDQPAPQPQPFKLRFQPTDFAALALVGLALLATLAAQNFGVSMREWRVVVLESVIFYFLVRLGLDFARQSSVAPASTQPKWVWRLIHAFLAGAVLQALLALYLYFFTEQAITAEGVRRALGPAYGSPNNLALFLDRAWPLLLALSFWPGLPRIWRGLYGLGLVGVSLALFLTFSKGALLLGLPAAVILMAVLLLTAQRARPAFGLTAAWSRRRIALMAGSILIILLIVFIPLSQTDRFKTTLDFNQGNTGFFRVKLWQASLTMLGDHWLLGVGLDNFLYQYRTRYILPEAWQEPNLSHPHNLILDFGTRLGVGGVLILVWLHLLFWKKALQLFFNQPSPLLLGLMGSMAVFLAHGLVDHSYFLVDLAFTFFLTVAIVQSLRNEEKILYET